MSVAAREETLLAPLAASSRVIDDAAELAVPIDEAWSVLAGVEAYGRWNPFAVEVVAPGGLVAGTDISLRLRWQNGLLTAAAEVVTFVDPPVGGVARLGWRFAGPLHAIGAVRAHRIQVLVADGPHRTRYRSREVFTGWAAWLLPLGYVARHVRAQTQALADQCIRRSEA